MKKVITLFTFIFLLQVGLGAQTLRIKVISLSDRKALPNIAFSVKQNDSLVYGGTTSNAGEATVNNLQAGTYSLLIDQANSYLVYRENFELVAGMDKAIEAALQVDKKNVLAEVIVTDKINRINTKDATVAHVVTKREIEALPIEGRDITRSLYRLPNVTLSTLSYNEAPNISINGLSGVYTNYLIDGMDNNERFLGNVKFNTPF